jgi:hypothetical protein
MTYELEVFNRHGTRLATVKAPLPALALAATAFASVLSGSGAIITITSQDRKGLPHERE